MLVSFITFFIFFLNFGFHLTIFTCPLPFSNELIYFSPASSTRSAILDASSNFFVLDFRFSFALRYAEQMLNIRHEEMQLIDQAAHIFYSWLELRCVGIFDQSVSFILDFRDVNPKLATEHSGCRHEATRITCQIPYLYFLPERNCIAHSTTSG